MALTRTQYGPNIFADYSTQNPAYYDLSSGQPQRVAINRQGEILPWNEAIQQSQLGGLLNEDNLWKDAVTSQGTNPSKNAWWDKALALGIPAAGAAIGFGAAGGLAGAGAGEAVSGTYAPTAGELGNVGATGTSGAGVGYGGAEPDLTPVGQGSGVAYGGATGTAAEGAASTAGTTGASVAKGTALSRILAGAGTTEDYLTVGGQVLPAALSAVGSYQQSQNLGNLANQYGAYGAPYRQNLADITNDPSKFYSSPAATQATDAILRRLSVTGNPAGNPYSQALGIDALYKEYGAERDRQAGYGGLTQYNAAAPGLAAGAIGAQGAIYGDIGYGLGNVLAPKKTLAQQLAEYKAAGGII